MAVLRSSYSLFTSFAARIWAQDDHWNQNDNVSAENEEIKAGKCGPGEFDGEVRERHFDSPGLLFCSVGYRCHICLASNPLRRAASLSFSSVAKNTRSCGAFSHHSRAAAS